LSAPYIIWTMQRTGGTTLAVLLAELSEHPKVKHEPFNVERPFGFVTRHWLSGGDDAQLAADMATVLDARPVIKHCHELVPTPLNRALMAASVARSYRHIVLDRRPETDRILSLKLAEQTGIWGWKSAREAYDAITADRQALKPLDVQAALAHLRHCQARRQALSALLHNANQTPFVIYFEDIYSDPSIGRENIRRLVEFLDIDPAEHPQYENQVSDALLNRGQDSGRILDLVPNIAEARAKLAAQAQMATFRFPSSCAPEGQSDR
jgi:LPS sulfotransferase NodH